MIRWFTNLWRIVFAPVGQRRQQRMSQLDARVWGRLRGIEQDTLKLIGKEGRHGE